jgi:hypothetical protein
MDMELLIEEFTREAPVGHVSIPMLVPGLGTVPRNIVIEEFNKIHINWTTVCKFPLGIRHLGGPLHRFFWR